MIELKKPNEWQHVDPELNMLYPWYTKSFLDMLKTWDLSDKVVWEYGLGASSVWWANKAKMLYGVDSNLDWYNAVTERIDEIGGRSTLYYSEQAESVSYDTMDASYNEMIHYLSRIHLPNEQFDIVVIDGLYRDQCVAPAIDTLKSGGVLIIDNWDQPSVWVANEKTIDQLKHFKYQVFRQEGHPDWKTAIFYKS